MSNKNEKNKPATSTKDEKETSSVKSPANNSTEKSTENTSESEENTSEVLEETNANAEANANAAESQEEKNSPEPEQDKTAAEPAKEEATADAPADQEAEQYKNPVLKAKTSIHALANSVERIFKENAASTLPRLTEKGVRDFAGHNGKVVNMFFDYSNAEKTKGCIWLEEFGVKYRCPERGEYEFDTYNKKTVPQEEEEA